MTVSIKDIAKQANVSTATVSLVLNKKQSSFISKATRQRILELAKELNYRPNVLARGLVKKKTNTIGVVIPDVIYPFFTEVIHGIETLANESDHKVILCYSGSKQEKEAEYVNMLLEQRVEGIIIAPLADNRNIKIFKRLIQDGFPLVFVDRYLDEVNGSYVVTDNAKGAYKAVRHLVKLGHKRILLLTTGTKISTVQSYLEGYKKALAKDNLSYRESLIKRCEETEAGENRLFLGYNIMKSFLLRKPHFTAIFATDDNFAVGAIKAVKEKELRVPEDIAVVGFDDLPFSSFVDPPLTSVMQQKYEMGEKAVKTLIEIVKKDDVQLRKILLEPKLVIRQSCGGGARIK